MTSYKCDCPSSPWAEIAATEASSTSTPSRRPDRGATGMARQGMCTDMLGLVPKWQARRPNPLLEAASHPEDTGQQMGFDRRDL